MRILLSIAGPDGGILVEEDRSTTRKALAEIPHDAVHLFAVDPDDAEIDRLRTLVERTGATFDVDRLDDEDLLATFERLVDAIEAHQDDADARDGPVEVHVQVNAGRHANLLSAAGLLACLHTGVPAHFVDEAGHTALPVLTRAPLTQLLDADEQAALVSLPDDGVPLADVRDHDPGALNALKDRDLIERDDDRLVLTEQGRAYQAHLSARGEPRRADRAR